VQLSDGSVGLVLSHNKQKRLKPEILLIRNAQNKILEKPRFIDLSKKPPFSNKERPCITGALSMAKLGVDVNHVLDNFNAPNVVQRMFA
ncbi:MAG: hypothetical protein OQK49_06240, partial [Proteobacteria bacterium]|nr:hypothetical protein [Pseudomonadota bacterium]